MKYHNTQLFIFLIIFMKRKGQEHTLGPTIQGIQSYHVVIDPQYPEYILGTVGKLHVHIENIKMP